MSSFQGLLLRMLSATCCVNSSERPMNQDSWRETFPVAGPNRSTLHEEFPRGPASEGQEQRRGSRLCT